MALESCVTEESKGPGFFNEEYKAATSSIRTEPNGTVVIR